MTPRICRTDGCQRATTNGWAYCDECRRRILGASPVEYRRVGTRPLPQITERELRLLWGDR